MKYTKEDVAKLESFLREKLKETKEEELALRITGKLPNDIYQVIVIVSLEDDVLCVWSQGSEEPGNINEYVKWLDDLEIYLATSYEKIF